jgi:thymidine phosphorylase
MTLTPSLTLQDQTSLKLRRLGINTYLEPVVYFRSDSTLCRSEGMEAQTRILVQCNGRSVVATLNVITDHLLADGEMGLSDAAWKLLGAEEGALAIAGHLEPVNSMSYVRGKVYGSKLAEGQLLEIVEDAVKGKLSDVELAAFVTASAGGRLDEEEIVYLTKAMIETGDRLHWAGKAILDKHCVGGLPGNRTTLLVVPIVTALGLTMPKTSSRAITSPAGTADTMEVLAPVELNRGQMQRVVEREGGCIVWGGSARLSPADDVFIRVERALEIDGTGQMVASILSKKAAAGATHVLIDIPVGVTAKLRSREAAEDLSRSLVAVGLAVGLSVEVMYSDGNQPVGRGIGPALEARDVLAVLQNQVGAPQDLARKAVDLSARLLEMGLGLKAGESRERAWAALRSGLAWRKFQAICEAQGGMRSIPTANFLETFPAPKAGRVCAIDNRKIAKIAKLAGAPQAKSAGVDLHVTVGQDVSLREPLFTVHAETPGELRYALDYAREHQPYMIGGEQ